MSKEIVQIKNISDTAYRFTALLKFIPGAITAVSAADIKAHPVINMLIKNGKLEIVGAQNESEDIIEEV